MNVVTTNHNYPPKNTFRNLVVRPIHSDERAHWDMLMNRHHYLGFDRLIGESIRYVAILDDRWVGLIGWGSAALCCEARDKWISWAHQVKENRLNLIANNIRFLILPSIKIHNLASKILSCNLKRLSKDWEAYYGHSILLAETFVDPSKFSGTCYKAAGWEMIGQTKGFRKSAKRYIYHGKTKMVWLKPLNRLSKTWLKNINMPKEVRVKKMLKLELSKKQQESLQDCIMALPDYRQAQGRRHSFCAIINMSICAILCGAKSYIEISDWCAALTQKQLKNFRAYYDRNAKKFIPPSEPTIRRVLQNADAEAIDNALNKWMYENSFLDDGVAVDGKVLCGAKDEEGKQLSLLSVFMHRQGVVIGQKKIGSKTNEIPEIKNLLSPINIAGKVVTADALHTQVETARFIVEDKQADYVFTVKDNQPTLKADIEALELERFSPRCPNDRERAWAD